MISLILCSPAFSYDNPDLLPEDFTPVIDLAKTLSDKQRLQLEKSLNGYEKENSQNRHVGPLGFLLLF